MNKLEIVWSAGYQPLAASNRIVTKPISTKTHADCVRARSLANHHHSRSGCSSEDDAEVRRVTITNLGVRARDVQVSSYAELSLTSQAADMAQPALLESVR